MVNLAIIVGYVGKDPDIKFSSNENKICNFSVATSKKHNDKEYTEWHNIVAFGRLAEICSEYLSKGALVYIRGSIESRTWDDKNGNEKKTTQIKCSEMKILHNIRNPDTGKVPF